MSFIKKLLKWLIGYRTCNFCGKSKPQSQLSIPVVAEDKVNYYCIDCLEERYGNKKYGNI